MADFPKEWKEIERIAKEVFDQGRGRSTVWTHKEGGAETGSTFLRNVAVFQEIGFKMRTIHDVKEADTSAGIFGRTLSCPVAIAPMSAAIAKVCGDSFLELAKGSATASIAASCGYPAAPDTLSKMVAAGAPVFRVIKPLRDKDRLIQEVQSSEQQGAVAVGIDVDSSAGLKPTGDEPHYMELGATQTVAELAEIRKATRLPFILKGIISVEDARAAVDSGADAVVVSTHAGFAMDYTQAPLEVLPSIRKAVGKKVAVILDSGIRRGSDVIKALALGADAVLIGRLALWGLALGGADGLAWVVKMIRDEMARTMTLMGVKSVADLNPGCLVPLGYAGERILRSAS